MGAVYEYDGVYLFLKGVLVFVVKGVSMSHRDPVASHLKVSSCSPVYWLNRCSFFSWICRSWMDPAVMLTSSA